MMLSVELTEPVVHHHGAVFEVTNQLTTVVELQADRVRLRLFRAEDAQDALEYRNDPEFARFLPHIPQPFTREDAENFVRRNMTEDWATSPTFAVALVDKLIGTVNFEIDPAQRSAMLGYAIGRRWWGRGLASEAARVAIGWARQEFGLQRIWASTDHRNERSRRVLEKLGFKLEGVRSTEGLDREGNQLDEVQYGLDLTV